MLQTIRALLACGLLVVLAAPVAAEERASAAATTPALALATLVFTQHFPFDEHGLFWRSSTLVYSAITD